MIIVGVTVGLIYGLVAIGYSLIWQTMGLLNFAQGDLVMVGAFVTVTLIEKGVANPLVVMVLVFVIMALVGALIERAAYGRIPRERVATLIVSTLGMGLILRNLVVLIWGTTARGFPERFFSGRPLTLGEVVIQPVYYWTLAIGVVVVMGLVLFLYRTKFGIAMRLTAYNQTLAELMGINNRRYQTAALAMAVGITGIAGMLVGPISFVHYNMGLSFGVKGFAAAIIGGLNSLPGSLVGGIILGLAEVYFGKYLSGYVDVLAFTIIIFILIVKPTGLFGRAHIEKI